MAAELKQMIRTIQDQLIKLQREKWDAVDRMDNPGFLELPILNKDQEKINENVKLIKAAMTSILKITAQQQTKISQFKRIFSKLDLGEITRLLANETSICEDIINESSPVKITKRIEELSNGITRTMGIIRGLIKSFST